MLPNWWYPLDITSIEIDGTLLVPEVNVRDFWDILRQAALTVCVLALFCWAYIGTGEGETALPQASMPTIYKQHLYNMTPYTLKYGPVLENTLFPVLGDNRTLRMRQPDH